jgi:hypothetical protein
MTKRENRLVDHSRRVLYRAGLPGLATAGLLMVGISQLSAEHGFKIGKKTATQPAAAPKPPSNGFVAAIRKLQEEAKHRAFDGDVDGAIACAQRARKIAEASSVLVSEDPECTVEAADRLVEKLMAVKSTAQVPARSPGAPTAPVPQHPVFAHRPLQPQPQAQHTPLPPPVPSWERPVASFAPHPAAATVVPVAVVAGGWAPETKTYDVAVEETSGDSIDEIVQSDERTFALLMARANARGQLPQPENGPADVVQRDEPIESFAVTESGADQFSAADSDWQTDSAEVTPTVQVEGEESPAGGQFQLLHQIQSDRSSDDEGAAPSSTQSIPTESDAPVATANQSYGAWAQEIANTSVQHAALSEEPETAAAAEVTPTSFAASSTISEPTPSRRDESHSALEEALHVPTVYFRDVEPAAAPAPGASKPAPAPALHLAERLAQWMRLPVKTVAVGLGGLGLILLGIGLSLARTSLRPRS